MKRLTQHVTRCFVAGMVALLPIAGTVLTVVYLEKQLASSWLEQQGFYFFGCGLLATAVLIYGMGLAISTFLGRWLWRRFDGLVDSLPFLGRLYQTLKQILGYGEGPDAVFRRVVGVPATHLRGEEVGLVTAETQAADGRCILTVFVPGAPNPTTGRVLLVDARDVRPLQVRVNDALMSLVSVGSIPIEEPAQS